MDYKKILIIFIIPFIGHTKNIDINNIKFTPYSIALSNEITFAREIQLLSNAQISYVGWPL